MANDLNAGTSIDARDMFWDIPHPISEETIPEPITHDNVATPKPDNGDDNVSTNESNISPRQHRKGWRKPQGMPKRPMSSYNLFFQLERERLVNGEAERVFTAEDIDRIAKIQKLKDLSCQKRKHRKSHGKISFAKLARVIADKWKSLDTVSKAAFYDRAAQEKDEYKAAVDAWAQTSKDNRSNTSSPPPTLINQLIESPPSGDEQYIQNQTTNTPPEVRQEMWEASNHQSLMDNMMINGIMDGTWIDTTPESTPMGFQDKQYVPTNLERIRKLRQLQSLARTKLQPRSMPTNIGYMEPNQHFNMRGNFVSPGFNPSKVHNMKHSPSSAVDNIYGNYQEFTTPSFANYELYPDQQSGFVNIDTNQSCSGIQNHARLMRRRTFALGEKDMSDHSMMKQRMLLSEYRHQSVPNMYNSRYNCTDYDELAGLPLESLVEVTPAQYLSSLYDDEYGMNEIRRLPQYQQRRSTFSGGYIDDKVRHENMMMGYNTNPSRASNQFYRREPQDELMLQQSNLPPVDVITFRREPQNQESYHQDQDLDGTTMYPTGNPSLMYDHDNVLGSYVARQHFGKTNNKFPFLNLDEEKAAAMDLISLNEHTKMKEYMKSVADAAAAAADEEDKAYYFNQRDPTTALNTTKFNNCTNMTMPSSSFTLNDDNRDTSESHNNNISNDDVPILNYDDVEYHTKQWAV